MRQFFNTLYNLGRGLQLTTQQLRQAWKPARHKAITDPAYFKTPTTTLQYPKEQLAVPDRGRYKLHNKMDDCILCDKCARVCPVDCIDIESIPSPVPLGKTSNGMTKRLHGARFDIDLAKCCFCNLCTTVCPTGSLTMTAEYDYSVFDWADHKVAFATMTPEEITAKKQAWKAHTASV